MRDTFYRSVAVRTPIVGSMVALVWIAVVTGCAPQSLPETPSQQGRRLTHMLRGLDRSVDPAEARRLAQEALRYSRSLAQRYHVTSSPWVHNFLVNIGLKKRGLCYQWADDLQSHLAHLHLATLAIYPIGAHIGDYWREHNALVVLPAHHVTPLSYGIVLDPWRHSGDLYFLPVYQDTAYHWSLRDDRIPKAPSDP